MLVTKGIEPRFNLKSQYLGKKKKQNKSTTKLGIYSLKKKKKVQGIQQIENLPVFQKMKIEIENKIGKMELVFKLKYSPNRTMEQ